MRGFCAALSLLILAGVSAAGAQTYPSRPITPIVAFPPAAFQQAEIEKWWPIIKDAGIGAQAQ